MRAASLCILALGWACGGSSGPQQLSIAGTYDTKVLVLPGNTCGPVTALDNPTVVAQTPGARTLTLTHNGNSYSGTVTDKGAFTVPATAVGGGAFTVSITGQFTSAGFTATVHVAQTQPPCAYDVSWTGTKSGPPNTYP
jgi:hypothetical protein